jgi:predicted transcriptional regulator
LHRKSEGHPALEETAGILAEPDVLSALDEGIAEIERGETVTFAELRRKLAERRPSN